MTPEDRYRHDPTFHSLVDILEAHLHAAEMTPTEIREAAMLAAIHHEMRRSPIRRVVVTGVAAADDGYLPSVLLFEGHEYRRA